MNEHDEADERLVAELRELFANADPVPPLVTKLAKASLGWRRLDAELAELLRDSALEEGSRAAARGGGAPVRSVSFGAGAKTIDIEIHVDGEHRMLLGQIVPAASVRIDIQTAENTTVTSVQSDALGRFRVQSVPGGVIRLLVSSDAQDSSPQTETSWIMI